MSVFSIIQDNWNTKQNTVWVAASRHRWHNQALNCQSHCTATGAYWLCSWCRIETLLHHHTYLPAEQQQHPSAGTKLQVYCLIALLTGMAQCYKDLHVCNWCQVTAAKCCRADTSISELPPPRWPDRGWWEGSTGLLWRGLLRLWLCAHNDTRRHAAPWHLALDNVHTDNEHVRTLLQHQLTHTCTTNCGRLGWILGFRVHVKLFYRIVSYHSSHFSHPSASEAEVKRSSWISCSVRERYLCLRH